MKVVLASKNAHKLKEISKITEKFGIELILQSELGIDMDVEENGSTFEENSYIKAKAVMEATGLPALADDSGIAVDALNGEPGIYSARYGFDDSLDDWGRLLLLLENTENVPDGSRQAQFVCVITLVMRSPRRIAPRPHWRRWLWLRSHFLLSALGQSLCTAECRGEKPGVPQSCGPGTV